ncbi:hypothetical protein SAMD00023353_0402000 [Rosellinia necatrix]|uniref:Uncharacterized protein n=1 Tax=Rosellinia necatrix TaxID=77044 RepID=A0A1S8A5B1_ROSNE|nr:hypothetical protein SAMD00023353_0402000 [Rosellinia necatrix]
MATEAVERFKAELEHLYAMYPETLKASPRKGGSSSIRTAAAGSMGNRPPSFSFGSRIPTRWTGFPKSSLPRRGAPQGRPETARERLRACGGGAPKALLVAVQAHVAELRSQLRGGLFQVRYDTDGDDDDGAPAEAWRLRHGAGVRPRGRIDERRRAEHRRPAAKGTPFGLYRRQMTALCF